MAENPASWGDAEKVIGGAIGLWLRMREAADRWDDAEPGSQEQQLAAAGLVADFQSLDHLLRPGPLAEKAQEDGDEHQP